MHNGKFPLCILVIYNTLPLHNSAACRRDSTSCWLACCGVPTSTNRPFRSTNPILSSKKRETSHSPHFFLAFYFVFCHFLLSLHPNTNNQILTQEQISMKKKLYTLSLLTIAATLATLTTACTNDGTELDPPFSMSTPKGSGNSLIENNSENQAGELDEAFSADSISTVIDAE